MNDTTLTLEQRIEMLKTKTMHKLQGAVEEALIAVRNGLQGRQLIGDRVVEALGSWFDFEAEVLGLYEADQKAHPEQWEKVAEYTVTGDEPDDPRENLYHCIKDGYHHRFDSEGDVEEIEILYRKAVSNGVR